MAELWDAYDRAFNKVAGLTLVRGEPLPEGIYHLVAEIAVRHTDGRYLLMQRDFAKHYGGMWELTAGGSALVGESAIACAARELEEETGIRAAQLTELGRVVQAGNHSLYVEYLCVTDCAPDAVRLQAGETVAYRWVDPGTLAAMPEEALAVPRTIRLLREQGLL